MKTSQKQNEATTRQPANFAAIIAILGAITRCYNDNATKASLANLGQPLGTPGVPSSVFLDNGETK
ncbi:MAG TPA: hypothetical protein VMT22_10750 [Terriglobales bacterium]|jgi:hypothetical protein|nr:hypothetical protein [Terriglobales bacterium]